MNITINTEMNKKLTLSQKNIWWNEVAYYHIWIGIHNNWSYDRRTPEEKTKQ